MAKLEIQRRWDALPHNDRQREKRGWARRQLFRVAGTLLIILLFTGRQEIHADPEAEPDFLVQAKTALARADVRLGLHSIDKGRADRGLAYLARGLRNEPGDVTAGSRIMSHLLYRSWPLAAMFLPNDTSSPVANYPS